MVKDTDILYKARNAAIDLIKEDPNLSNPKNSVLQKTFSELTKTSKIWENIS